MEGKQENIAGNGRKAGKQCRRWKINRKIVQEMEGKQANSAGDGR